MSIILVEVLHLDVTSFSKGLPFTEYSMIKKSGFLLYRPKEVQIIEKVFFQQKLSSLISRPIWRLVRKVRQPGLFGVVKKTTVCLQNNKFSEKVVSFTNQTKLGKACQSCFLGVG